LATGGTIAAPFKMVGVGVISLNVPERVVDRIIVVVIVGRVGWIPGVVGNIDPVNPGVAKIGDAMFCVIINHCSNAINLEVVREVSVIVRVAVGIDTCLEFSNNVSVFGGGGGTKGDVCVVARGEIHVLLGPETKVQHVALAELEDVCVPMPERLGN
jgi:hypothetical protein